MKKTAAAFAVGALFSAPAVHAQIVFGNDSIGTMQIYGKLYPQVIYGKSSGATQPGESVSTLVSTSGVLTGAAVTDPGGRTAVDTQNSYLGFRGQRKLGSTGLTGLWQIEQSLEFDTGTGVWSNRNSFLGLAGGFGTVKLGNMDTIYKEYGQAEQIFGLTSGNFISPSNVLSQSGLGGTAGRFHERAPNSIQYQSPEWSGFQLGAQWSPDETHNDVPDGPNAELWSFGVKYEKGPLYLSAQHEIHKDRFGGSVGIPVAALRNNGTAGAHSDDKAYRLSAAYKFGNHRVAADVAKLEYNESGQAPGVAKFLKYEHTTMAVSLESSWGGPWRTALMYSQGNEGSCELTIGGCSTTGLTGKLFVAGLAYDLDRQTFLYALYGLLQNGASARYDNWAASSPARGGDVTQFAVGMQYRF